jgi:hypothetical protein
MQGQYDRQFEMGMRIDAAGHHIAAAGVDHLGARGSMEVLIAAIVSPSMSTSARLK